MEGNLEGVETVMFPNEPPEVTQVIDVLISAGFIVRPTGSRYICPDHCREDSDWDLMIYSFGDTPDVESLFPDLEIEPDGSNDSCLYYKNCNLIFLPIDQMDAWIQATHFCKDSPNCISRANRIKVFKSFEKGWRR